MCTRAASIFCGSLFGAVSCRLGAAGELALSARGSEPAAPSHPKLALPDQSTLRLEAQRYFTDLQLVNQDGKRLRFYSDLIDGKVVVINSFFAGCTGICKVTMPLFQRLQEKFADRTGDTKHPITISDDPEADTPASLKNMPPSSEQSRAGTFERRQGNLTSSSAKARPGHRSKGVAFEYLPRWKWKDRPLENCSLVGAAGGDCRGGGKRPRRWAKNLVPGVKAAGTPFSGRIFYSSFSSRDLSSWLWHDRSWGLRGPIRFGSTTRFEVRAGRDITVQAESSSEARRVVMEMFAGAVVTGVHRTK